MVKIITTSYWECQQDKKNAEEFVKNMKINVGQKRLLE